MTLKLKAPKRPRKRNKKFPDNVCGQCLRYDKCKGIYYMAHPPCNSFKVNRKKLVTVYEKKKELLVVQKPQPVNATFEALVEALEAQLLKAKRQGFSIRRSYTYNAVKCGGCGKKQLKVKEQSGSEIMLQCPECGYLKVEMI